MTHDELLAETGISDRTLRHYINRGVVPSPIAANGHVEFEHVYVHVLAILRLKQEGVYRLGDIRERLDAMTSDELQTYAMADDGEDEADGDGEGEGSHDAAPAPALPPAQPSGAMQEHVAPARAATSVEEWSRVLLRPGLELHLRHDAPHDARRLARAIVELCGVPSPD